MKETKFKQTEVGMIPSDWDVKPLLQLCDKFLDGDWIEADDQSNDGYRLIQTGNVGNGRYLDKANRKHFISEATFKRLNCTEIFEGDVLVSRLPDPVGRSCILPKSKEKRITAVDCTIIHFKKFDPLLFVAYTQTKEYQNAVNECLSGSTRLRISRKNLGDLFIPVPSSKDEQQRIANALSDVDSLINNLEKLIAKKKNVKQGAMQQLLTGRKRLPGFGSDERTGARPTDERRKECHSERSAKREVEESSGYKMTELGLIPSDWEVKTIKDLGVFLGGGTPSTKNESFWKGNIPWISSADLNDDDIEHISMTRFITQEAVNCSATQICPQGTILIIARVGVGKLALSQQKVCTSQDFCNLIPSKENCSKFLAYALLPVMKRMANESQGTSIKGVAVDEIKKVQILVPSSKAEQTAIANVLSDMDTEIATLETKLAKYRKLKTGMMQQLLTGKIRLV